MNYGRLFNKMMNLFPGLRVEFSSNRFSGLNRKELNKIAHELFIDGAWGERGNYTHMNNVELARNCYDCVSAI